MRNMSSTVGLPFAAALLFVTPLGKHVELAATASATITEPMIQ